MLGVLAGAVLLGAAAAGITVALAGGSAPLERAPARLVPATAFAYAGISTDPDRRATERGGELIREFPALRRLRDAALRRLAGGRSLDLEAMRGWLGEEAGVAIVPNRDGIAAILVVLGVEDEPKARVFLEQIARPTSTQEHDGVQVTSYGAVASAFVDGQLALGPLDVVQASIDAAHGEVPALADADAFADAIAGLPDTDVLEAYATSAGVRRLLAPAGGVVGIAGTLLDRPALVAAAAGLEVTGDAAHIAVHSLLDPQIGRRRRSPFQAFAPTLPERAPADAVAYLGLAGVDESLVRVLGEAAGAAPLRERLDAVLEGAEGALLGRRALALLEGEVALVLTAGERAPVFTLLARVGDDADARAAMRRLQAPLAGVLAPGVTARPAARRIAGKPATVVSLGRRGELAWAVDGGVLAVSTSAAGIEDFLAPDGSLADAGEYREATAGRPDRVSSLLFLDLSQLLELGERGGLGASAAYAAVRPDLSNVQAIGAFSSGDEEESSAEVSVLFP